MVGSIILSLSLLSQNIYIIYISIILFGFLISNVMPIIYRQSVRHSPHPIPVTISHVSSIAFTSHLWPAIVGFSAETYGLTFNMYMLGLIMFLISLIMLYYEYENGRSEGKWTHNTKVTGFWFSVNFKVYVLIFYMYIL